ncbi:Uncharacterized protein DAT39_015377 [Clarias magur]|uniref:Uncharacterized protein n=1 Tax=Clarias magur TaxID=1594786 RepID=A0A8J4UC31_CLAMG|nr:Uncharacterized protein DAT39_015377 [Clarias magur]
MSASLLRNTVAFLSTRYSRDSSSHHHWHEGHNEDKEAAVDFQSSDGHGEMCRIQL